MTNKYYKKKNNERLRKVARERYQYCLKKKKTNVEKRPGNDIKVLLNKKKKKSVNVITNLIKIFLRNNSRS